MKKNKRKSTLPAAQATHSLKSPSASCDKGTSNFSNL